jgi:hypothetical protein
MAQFHYNNFGKKEIDREREKDNAIAFYARFPNFDWIFYTNSYPDLKKANIKTEYTARTHYISNGCNENRRTHKVVTISETPKTIQIQCFLPPSTNIYISKAMHTFECRVLQKYKWKKENPNPNPNPNNCMAFFGVYMDADIEAIYNYKNGIRYILWGGEDIGRSTHASRTINEISELTNCIHLAISDSVYCSATRAFSSTRNKHTIIRVNFNLVDHSLFFKQTSNISENANNTKVLVFNGQTPGRESIYGEKIYLDVIRKIRKIAPYISFIFSNTLNATYKEMPNIYQSCFIMIRLSLLDGNANSVQECEAMGIPVVHNLSEYGLKWSTSNDVIRHILNIYNSNKSRLHNS